MKYLKAEKACRADLEMYVGVINAQKNTLESDTDKIRNEMKEGKTRASDKEWVGCGGEWCGENLRIFWRVVPDKLRNELKEGEMKF